MNFDRTENGWQIRGRDVSPWKTPGKTVSRASVQWVNIRRTVTGFMIWREMSGSGAAIGIDQIPTAFSRLAGTCFANQKGHQRVMTPKNQALQNGCSEVVHSCAATNTVLATWSEPAVKVTPDSG